MGLDVTVGVGVVFDFWFIRRVFNGLFNVDRHLGKDATYTERLS